MLARRFTSDFPSSLFASVVILVGLQACGSSQAGTMTAPTETAVAAPASASSLPEAGEIFESYITAIGGRDTYQAIKTRTVTGSFAITANGMGGPLQSWQQAPGNMRLQLEIKGFGTVVAGVVGEMAWSSDPASGTRVFEGKELSSALRDALFYKDLEWKTVYTSVETLAKEDFDGVSVFKVKATAVDGTVVFSWFAEESGLLLKTESTVENKSGSIKAVSTFHDYKDVAGLLVPHRMVQNAMGMEQVFTFSEIKHNSEIAAEHFAIPEDVQTLLKRAAETTSDAK